MQQYTVRSGQNIYDIAIELHGTVEGIFDLLVSNDNLSMESVLKAGDVLNYHKDFMVNETVASWLGNNDISVKNGDHQYDFIDMEGFAKQYIAKHFPGLYASIMAMSPDERNLYWEKFSIPRMIVKQHGKTSSISTKLTAGTRMMVDWGDCNDPQMINGSDGNAYKSLQYLSDYLYLASYIDIDYDYAKEYYLANNPEPQPSGCSSVRSGDWFGRNLDWFYDNTVEFVVTTPHANGRKAVLGVAGIVSGLTKDVVESGSYNELYKIVPFRLLDGINEDRLFCNTNVVPTDKGLTTETVPEVEERDRICTTMIPRYILDRFSTADEAIDYLRKYVAIYPSQSIQQMGYESHLMIGDSDKTYVVEIIDNQLVAHEHSRMTNFYIDGVVFNSDGKVYTPADVPDGNLPSVKNHITDLGSGLERYNVIVENQNNANTKEGMRSLMNKLLYTQAYDETKSPFWYTEFVMDTDDYSITVDTPPTDEDMVAVLNAAFQEFAERTRSNPTTWQTNHSCVYDIRNCKLYIVSQEDTAKEFEIRLKRNDEVEDHQYEYTYKDDGEHVIKIYGDFACQSLDVRDINGTYYPLSEIHTHEFQTALHIEDINKLIIIEQ